MSDNHKSSRLRSPPYPTIPLHRAIERAGQLYRQEREHFAPIASAAVAWGVSPTSSSPVQIVGALRQYGLLEDDGSNEARRVRVTRDALRILLDNDPTSKEREAAIKRAFFAPKIFSEISDRWPGELPSDNTIIRYLTLDRRMNNLAPFSEKAAQELLASYRASLPLVDRELSHNAASPPEPAQDGARLGSYEERQTQPQDDRIAQSSQPSSQPRASERAKVMEHERVLSDGLLSKGATYRLIVSGHVGLKEIERLIKKLEIDKEILAEDDADLEQSNNDHGPQS